MIHLHIEAIPSSNNSNQGKGGMKRVMSYQSEKKLWNSFIWTIKTSMIGRGELRVIQLPLQEATILLHYHFKTKARRDPDNYSGKMILDGLKNNGFISDDSFKEIDIFPMADFGKVKSNSMDIYIIEGRKLLTYASELVHENQVMDQLNALSEGVED
jgi:crossover junction endodeoxyribonuclease RusA